MRLADEFLELRDRGGFLVENARDHFRRGQHEQFLRLELTHRARDLAEDFVGDRFGGLDAAAPFAGRARFAQLALEAFDGALARHLHEAERRHLVHGGFGVIARERFFEHAQHLALVLFIGHVDEIDDDDAAEVAQTKLTRGRLRRLEIGLVNRLLEVAMAQECAGVDVDRRHRFGLVDYQITTGLQWHFLLERTLNFVLDAVEIEDRPLARIMFDAIDHIRDEGFGEAEHAIEGFAGVHAHLFDIAAHQIAQCSQRQRKIFINPLAVLGGGDALLQRSATAWSDNRRLRSAPRAPDLPHSCA